MKIIRWLSIAYFLMVIAACSKVSEDRVMEDFNRIFPEHEIVSVLPSEGDADNVYYQIRFKQKNSNEAEQVLFLYQRDLSDNSWMLRENYLDSGSEKISK